MMVLLKGISLQVWLFCVSHVKSQGIFDIFQPFFVVISRGSANAKKRLPDTLFDFPTKHHVLAGAWKGPGNYLG